MGNDRGFFGMKINMRASGADFHNRYFSGILVNSQRVGEKGDFRWRLWHIDQNDHVILQVKHTVAFLIYNPDRRAIAIVSQKRPAVSMCDGSNGEIDEAPAGHIEESDLDDILAVMAREANEELGAKFIPNNHDFQLITSAPLYLSPGHMTERMYLGYTEAGDEMFDNSKTKFGVAAEGEETEIRWFSIDGLSKIEWEDMKTFALVQWFLNNRDPRIVE